MKVVIFAGGLGTSISEETETDQSLWLKSEASPSCGTS